MFSRKVHCIFYQAQLHLSCEVHRNLHELEVNKKTVGSKESADKLVKNIRRKMTRRYSAEEKIRIVLVGLHGE